MRLITVAYSIPHTTDFLAAQTTTMCWINDITICIFISKQTLPLVAVSGVAFDLILLAVPSAVAHTIDIDRKNLFAYKERHIL